MLLSRNLLDHVTVESKFLMYIIAKQYAILPISIDPSACPSIIPTGPYNFEPTKTKGIVKQLL